MGWPQPLHCRMAIDSGSSVPSPREVWEQAHQHVRVYDLDGEIVATGETYQLSYIQVLRAMDGRIVWMRDYMDPRVFSRIEDS